MLASRLGGHAVELLIEGKTALGVGIKQNELTQTPFDDIFSNKGSKFNFDMYELAQELSI